MDDIVPFAMEARGPDVNGSHLFLGDFSSGAIAATIQSAGDFQPFGRGCACNQMHNCFVVPQGLAAPIGSNEREQTVFDLVPLAGARRELAYCTRNASLVG